MKINNSSDSLRDGLERLLNLSVSRQAGSSETTKANAAKENVEDALDLVELAKENMHNETMRTWDRHTDMVAKSQKLRQTRERQEAVKRLTQERREDQTELMAKIAIENANRSQMLEARSLERQAKEKASAA